MSWTLKVESAPGLLHPDLDQMSIGSQQARVPEPVFAFVDLSNVWYGLRNLAAIREPGEPVRLSAESLRGVLAAGREPYHQITVANADVPAEVIGYFQKTGEVILRESGRHTMTEQANDETLLVRMYEAMHQQPSSVMVLATGDAAGWVSGQGFLPALEAARVHQWGVEVASWRASAHNALAMWLQHVEQPYIELDDYYYSVSFVENGRRVQPVLLTHRPCAVPRSAADAARL
jgi:hypothetical protein